MPSSPALAVVGLVATLAAAGCGKTAEMRVVSVQAPAHTTAAQPPSGKGPGKAPPVSAAQRAFATAVNLTASDLPGFAPTPRHHEAKTAAESNLEAQLASCVGAVAGIASAKGESSQSSPDFKRRGRVLQETVSSAVSFLASGAEAARTLPFLRSAHTRECLRRYLGALFGGSRFGGLGVRRVFVTQGTPPAPGTSGGFGWRITALVTTKGVQVPFYMDILGFIDGRAEVTMLSTGAIVPFSAVTEEHLYSLLVSRATSQRQ